MTNSELLPEGWIVSYPENWILRVKNSVKVCGVRMMEGKLEFASNQVELPLEVVEFVVTEIERITGTPWQEIVDHLPRGW